MTLNIEKNIEIAKLCKALGHEARVQIVSLLHTEGSCITNDFVTRLPLAQSTISQHIKVLVDSGWIKRINTGTKPCYVLDRETLQQYRQLSVLL